MMMESKMAPLCTACRLPLLRILLLLLLLSFFVKNVSPLLTYDRQTLLKIRDSLVKPSIHGFSGQSKTLPPLLASIPHYLLRLPAPLPRKSRHRRRGKRSGVLVTLRAYLSRSSDYHPCSSAELPWEFNDYVVRHSSESRWLRSAVPDTGYPQLSQRRVRICKRGSVRENLRLVPCRPQQTDHIIIRAALVNTRSLTNKTFILNDFFSTHFLDFLLLTETWTKPGDNSVFTELLPPRCSFFSSPRASGRGGGVATVFKDNFKCKLLHFSNYSSFEMQLFTIELARPVLCAVIYCPPKYNKDFIQDFSEFLADVVPKYEHILVCGDFNIHVCCPSDQFANDFRRLLTSFDLIQSVDGPTHNAGHTLDLILSHGLSVSLVEISETVLSDHLPIIFNFLAPPPLSKPPVPASCRRIITSFTVEEFTAAFIDSQFFTQECAVPECPDTLLSSFYKTCSGILDTIAPFKHRSTKPRTDPWLNDTTRALRQRCRQAERR
ncbi:hypothetical protein NQD34_000800 [Periophthalmus magnuspinnatus]|nr:hypothetical protein NQD34_000800 [Periophthalmus magnuspinnatus]